MKILVGEFVSETNENIPQRCRINNYVIAFDDQCIQNLNISEVYESENAEMIPTIYANGASGGLITPETFAYIETSLLNEVKKHLNEIDGIFLMLHGASKVEGLGSGDHHIIQEVRKLVGPYLPIAVACDPHGNLTQEYVESLQIIRSYRQSPHTDANETLRIVSKMLIDLVRSRQNIHAVYRKLPLILGGEQSVSTDEPVLSINRYMDKLEQDPRILSASWHVGYLRHDCPEAGCGIVVVPASEADQDYAETMADQLADYVWQRRHEFHYTGLTAEPEEALEMALNYDGKPVVITDSGDNTTSGAMGWNTFVLRQVLAEKNLKKQVLFATICDPKTFNQLQKLSVGDSAAIRLGMDYDELSKAVDLEVVVKAKGPITGFMMHNIPGTVYGETISVTVKNSPITIMIATTSYAICEIHQFADAGLNFDDYDVIIVKQGYIFPELKAAAKFYVMSLTDGATLQDTRRLTYKQIMRPMYPIDEI